MASGRQIDALDEVQVREQIEGAEDGGAAHVEAPPAGVPDEIVGSEVTRPIGDEPRDRAPRLGQPIARPVDGVHECLRLYHDGR